MAVTAVSMLPWPEMITTGRSGCSFLMAGEHLEAVEAAALQPDVEDDQVRPPLLDRLQGLVGIAREPRAVPLVLENSRHQIANVGLVVDDQDVRRHRYLPTSVHRGFGAPKPPSGPSRWLAGSALLARARQRDAHERALRSLGRPGRIFERQRAAMLLDDLLDDGEAEAGALAAFGRDVRLEQLGAVLLRQARAVVDDLDLDQLAVAAQDRLDCAVPSGVAVARRTAAASTDSVAFLTRFVKACASKPRRTR